MCKITGIDAHVLRYWETEFRELSPRKNKAGKRLYRDADILIIENIKNLLYVRKYTIEGARQVLKNNRKSKDTTTDKDDLLQQITQDLLELKSLLDNYTN